MYGKKYWKKKRQIEGGWFYSELELKITAGNQGKDILKNLIGGYEESLTHWPNKQINKNNVAGYHLLIRFWLQLEILSCVILDAVMSFIPGICVSCWQAVPFISTIRFCKSVDIIFLHHFVLFLILTNIEVCYLLCIS